MSKSIARVKAALDAAGLSIDIIETDKSTRTAAEAAEYTKCHIDQIAKSMIFKGASCGKPILFLTAGGQRVDQIKAAKVASEELSRADPAFVRQTTGFAIGGVAPVGHPKPITCFIDQHLLAFDEVWAAAGTPHHLFRIEAKILAQISNAETADFTAE